MSRFLVLLCVVLLPTATAINVTNSGNQQEIKDIKKDLTMLRSLVISLNTSLISTQIDKDEKVKEMNATIQAQQVEMRTMNSTIQAQLQEMKSMNSTIQAQLQEMRSMNSTIYGQKQEINASNQEYQRELRTLNATIQAQQQEMKSMNATIQAQKQVERSMNTSIETQQKEVTYLISTVQDQQHKTALMESNIQILMKENQTLHDELKVYRENNSAEIENLKEADEKGNQNYGAFQVIVQDLVTNVNTLRNTSQLQIGRINDNLTSLARQIHYTSLSFLDAQKILKDLENSTQEMNINVSSIFKKLESQGQEMNNLQSEAKINISSIFKKLESQETEMKNLQSEINRTYAFTVSTSSGLTNYNNKKIVYDKVITNKGRAYNNNTGIFTCPSPGTYVFTWSTMSHNCYAYIYHNGNQLLMSYSSSGGNNEVASNTIVLALTAGDHVWIQISTGTYCHGYPYTAFSGWKV